MNVGKPIFAQIISFLPKRKFRRLVRKYEGDRRVRTFTCWDQLLCMIFAQLTYRESLRDIEACLRALAPKLYHMGIGGNISRTNLARANETRHWQIYRDLAQHLIATARKLYANDQLEGHLKASTYAFDSTTIELCMSLFPWARPVRGRYDSYKSSIKLHTLLDLRGNIPTFIHFTDGKVHDVCALDQLNFEPSATYVLDRGYFDLKRLNRISTATAFFITRPKKNVKFKRLLSQPSNHAAGIRCDQIIRLDGVDTLRYYPGKLRRISFCDPATGKRIVFLTNHFVLSATTVADLYKSRWQIELFFKWVKQHLRIKNFYGTSENAVKTQIWIAVATYVLVAIIKKQLKLEHSLYTILQVLSVSSVEKIPISQAFQSHIHAEHDVGEGKQLNLFGI